MDKYKSKIEVLMTINTCEWCGTVYPDEDETEVYYNIYVFGKEHIICGSCKEHLDKMEKK